MNKEKNSTVKTVVDLPKNVVRSIFRNPLPSSDRGRAATSFTNFFLHIQPVRVSKRVLKPSYTMGLGLISLFLFVILAVTGVLLMFYYVPSTTQAYDRMLDLRSSVAFGVILRNMHRWAAHAMVAVVFLHMCRVFFTGAYKTPREFNWLIGVALFLLTLLSSFTGYLLPWDQLAFWAITVGTSIAGYAPVIGNSLRFLLLGDSTVGQEALLRFYVLHVVVLPALHEFVGCHPFLAHPQRWWTGQARIREGRCGPCTGCGGCCRAGSGDDCGHRIHALAPLHDSGAGARTVCEGGQARGGYGLQLAQPADRRVGRAAGNNCCA